METCLGRLRAQMLSRNHPGIELQEVNHVRATGK